MDEWEEMDEPDETDHIWPEAEGGPDEPWNKRRIPRSQNRSKGAEMPSLADVMDSSEPWRLAAEIDRHSLEKGFKNPRNRDRGFGGLKRR
jgi:5-methylcytosine-specific restriction endonuclease McrA